MKELEDRGSGYAAGYYDYGELIDSMEYEVVTQQHDNDYQGDSRYLLLNPETGELGYLIFGWGSCSGCDALQSCVNIEEVTKLRDDLHRSIVWKDDADAMLEWMRERNWGLSEWYYHKGAVEEFLTSAFTALGSTYTTD